MLIELHSLTSHAPANLNRDDLGRPKSAIFGGTQRARISSQAIKRSIRTSNYLENLLGNALSTRSRQIPKKIHDDLSDEGLDVERVKTVCEAFTKVIGKPDKKNKLHTSQIVFMTAGEIERVKEYLRNIITSTGKSYGTALSRIGKSAVEQIGLNRNPGDGIDLALFGRMMTDGKESDNKPTAEEKDSGEENAKRAKVVAVDAAMQVAHAISTHTVTPEVDWFTAVDDIADDSAHLNETEFNSAVFYKYFSCNLPLLIRNLNDDAATAIEALAAVFDAACRVTPGGKQNSFASHALADTVLLVCRKERIPVSLANAFERPVGRDGHEESGYLSESRQRMIDHYRRLRNGYSLNDQTALFTTSDDIQIPEGTVTAATLAEVLAWMRTQLADVAGVGQ